MGTCYSIEEKNEGKTNQTGSQIQQNRIAEQYKQQQNNTTKHKKTAKQKESQNNLLKEKSKGGKTASIKATHAEQHRKKITCL